MSDEQEQIEDTARLQLQLRPFRVWAGMHDGSSRRATVYGAGTTYQQQLQDAVEQARRLMAGAEQIVVR